MPQVVCLLDWMMVYGLFLSQLCWVEVVVSRIELCFVGCSLLKDFLSQQLTFPHHSLTNEGSKRCGGLLLTLLFSMIKLLSLSSYLEGVGINLGCGAQLPT
jgi:hypothetical protein